MQEIPPPKEKKTEVYQMTIFSPTFILWRQRLIKSTYNLLQTNAFCCGMLQRLFSTLFQ